jgi:hypothetical protein
MTSKVKSESPKPTSISGLIGVALAGLGLMVTVLATVEYRNASYRGEFVEEFSPRAFDSEVSVLEEQAVVGLIKRVAEGYGLCRATSLMGATACAERATKGVLFSAARDGDVQIAKARLRIMVDYGLPLDPELRREAESLKAMDRSEALALLAKR